MHRGFLVPCPRLARTPFLFLALLARIAVALAAASSVVTSADDTRSGGAHTFSVLDFGAAGDGVTKDTAAIVRAVAAVAAAGEGTVFFPGGGRRYLTAPFNLTSHCTLFVDAGGTILGSSDVADWPVIPALPSYG